MSANDEFGRPSGAAGQTARAAGRGLRATAVGTARASRWVRRNVGVARNISGVGNVGMMRLLDLHAISCAGDTLITIGLASTIFFAVPAGEARGRVALYLLITMVPFALLAPLVGPLLDRFRHGRRFALAATFLGRAILTWVIADNLSGFGLYPAAFGVLALSRAYGVARSAAVPRLLPPGLGLSQAGARASVYGTVAGAIIAPIGLLTSSWFNPAWPLRIAAIIFVVGVIISFMLPPTADSDAPEVPPKVFHLPWRQREEGGRRILSGNLLVSALISSASLRGLYGFLLLFLAFAIRADDVPRELAGIALTPTFALGAVGVALGLGTFLSTAIGTGLKLRRPARVQAFGLGAVALAGIAVAINFSFSAILAFCLTTAVASGLAKLAVDATIQDRVPDDVRASAFAHSETLLMLAWVTGGALGLIPFDGRIGVTLAALAVLAAFGRAFLAARRLRDELLGRPGGQVARRSPGSPAPGSPAPGSPTLGSPTPTSPTAGAATKADATILAGTVTNVTTTPLPNDAPPGYHVYQPTAPDAGVNDPRATG